MRVLLLLCLLCFSNISHSAKILTISDSIVDYILFIDEKYLDSVPGKKGGCELIDDTLFQKIIRDSGVQPIVRPGSSAVNMIKGLQQLGHQGLLVTTVGEDQEGEFFLKSLQDQGVCVFLQTALIPTGKSACLVTENGDRTMRTFLGASKENHQLQLKEAMFEGVSHFHLEGYQLKHHRLVKEALHLAKQKGITVSLDLSSFEVVRANKEFIWELLGQGFIDILFSNQAEAFSLTGLSPKQAAEKLSSHCAIAVVTMGENGCYAQSGSHQWHCPAQSVEVYDTIGAGDLFIAGFLHGFLSGQSLKTNTCWGTLLASHVVQVIGAEIPGDRWGKILKEFSTAEKFNPKEILR